MALASLDRCRACQAHSYEGWVCLSPPATFGPGDVTGSCRRGTTTLLLDDQGVSRISPEDLALAVVDELGHPGGRQRSTVVAFMAEVRGPGVIEVHRGGLSESPRGE